MSELNLTSLITKYDKAEVEADLANLAAEIADEDATADALLLDTVAKSEAVKTFLDECTTIITEQHSKMVEMVADLKSRVVANMSLEAADADYVAMVTSSKAKNVAKMMAEITALSELYHKLLFDTGRAGRYPLV
jgi:nitrate reductase assembly molybdenum cofactor insertion protein NarJ